VTKVLQVGDFGREFIQVGFNFFEMKITVTIGTFDDNRKQIFAGRRDDRVTRRKDIIYTRDVCDTNSNAI